MSLVFSVGSAAGIFWKSGGAWLKPPNNQLTPFRICPLENNPVALGFTVRSYFALVHLLQVTVSWTAWVRVSVPFWNISGSCLVLEEHYYSKSKDYVESQELVLSNASGKKKYSCKMFAVQEVTFSWFCLSLACFLLCKCSSDAAPFTDDPISDLTKTHILSVIHLVDFAFC